MKYLSLAFLLVLTVSKGATYYVSQTAQGSGDGSSAGNAAAVTFFNTASNWSGSIGTAGKISPGDTVVLVGTVSSELVTQGAGLSGNVITITFNVGAKMSKAFWSTRALSINHAFVTVDGAGIGIIECTDNGTNLGNHVDCTGVYVNSVSNITIKDLTIRNIYVRVSGTEAFGYGSGVFLNSSYLAISNATVSGCTISNASNGIVGNFGAGATNWLIDNNTVSGCNWSINAGDRGGVLDSLTNLVISRNTCTSWSNWNQPNNDFHHNAVFIYVNGPGSCTSPVISGNTFGPGFGGVNQTSAIYMNGGVLSPYVYNNLFIPGTGESAQNGMVALSSYQTTSFNIYNNTFVQPIGSGGGPCIQISGTNGKTSTLNIRNNITQGPWFYNVVVYSNGGTLVKNVNHNVYFNAPTFSIGSGGETLAAWQSYGYDADALTTTPNLDGSYFPVTVSSSIHNGADLSAVFTTDKAGLSRSVPWDIGAYKYVGSNAAPVITVNPSSQSVTAGGNVSFTASASGLPTPTWQWYKDASPIGGATSTTLQLLGVASGDAGSYTATATNSAGSATTSAAVLTVTTPSSATGVPATPVITGIIP